MPAKIQQTKAIRMGLQTLEKDKVVVLSIEGNLMREGASFDDFLHKLKELHEANKINVVINFDKCSYVNSQLLSAIFQLGKRLLAKGGDVRFSCIKGMIERLFKETNLVRMVEAFDSVESAIASYQTGKH